MGNYVTAVRNYLIATPSQLGNYKIADMYMRGNDSRLIIPLSIPSPAGELDSGNPDHEGAFEKASKPDGHGEEAVGAPSLNTVLKRTFTGIAAVVAVLAGIAVFTAPFAKSGSELIAISLASLAVITLAGTGLAAIYTYRRRNVTVRLGFLTAVAIMAVAIGAGAGYLAWHSR
jgi:hypothetical protein